MSRIKIVVLGVVAVLFFSGCGGGSSSSDDNTNPITQSGFTQSDLSGTWEYIALVSGDSPNQTPGWYYGDWTIDGSGNMTTSTPVTDSLGNNTWVPTSGSAISISSTGIVTLNNDPGFGMHGSMNSAKNIIAVTSTMCPGSSNDVCGYNLGLWVKK